MSSAPPSKDRATEVSSPSSVIPESAAAEDAQNVLTGAVGQKCVCPALSVNALPASMSTVCGAENGGSGGPHGATFTVSGVGGELSPASEMAITENCAVAPVAE